MLIQCKRTKDNVGIETVKAFWAGVQFERAAGGLIATTAAGTPLPSSLNATFRHYPPTRGASHCSSKEYNASMRL